MAEAVPQPSHAVTPHLVVDGAAVARQAEAAGATITMPVELAFWGTATAG